MVVANGKATVQQQQLVAAAAGDHVTVEKVSTVVPATPTEHPARPMFLTICDQVCRSYPYINRIFFFGRNKKVEEAEEAGSYGDDFDEVVDSLKAGLAKALVVFYPLAGRFSVDSFDGRLQIDCNDRGVDFVEASSPLPFSELRHDGFQYRSLFWKLARRTSLLRSDYIHLPILSVQITKFADGGGITVGVSLSHAVADAQSFYDFVRSWAEICRGAPLSVTPKHIRMALSVESLEGQRRSGVVQQQAVEVDDMVKCMKKLAMAESGQEVGENGLKPGDLVEIGGKLSNDTANLVKPQLELQKTVKEAGGDGETAVATRVQAPVMEKQLDLEEHRAPRTDLVQKVFTFSYESLQKLKGKASSGGKAYTTFESFCAHWWQGLIRARELPAGQAVFLLIPINCRQRFLGLPEGYFGNSLDGGLVKMTAGELCHASLPEITARVHAAIVSVTEDSFREYILQAEARRNAIPHFDRTGLFHVVDSPKYPVYDIDFGLGRPLAVRAEGFRFGAEVQILAGRLGGGSVDMFCALDSDTMCRLERDPLFLAAAEACK